MKYRFVLIITISICSFIQLFGQEKDKLDSFWITFNQAKHDTTRISSLLKIGEYYEYINLDSSLCYYSKAIMLASKNIDNNNISPEMSHYYKLQKASLLTSIGNAYWTNADYDNAILSFKESILLYETCKHMEGIAIVNMNIGNVLNEKGDYIAAIEYLLKSYKYFEEYGDDYWIANISNSIGNSYYYQKNLEVALEYYLEAYSLYEKMNFQIGIAGMSTNLGLIYEQNQQSVLAVEYYSKSLEISKELDDEKGIADACIHLGNVYDIMGDHKKAFGYYSQSLQLSEKLNDLNNMVILYGNFASLNMDIADSLKLNGKNGLVKKYLDTALSWGLKSLNLSKEINAIALIYESAGILRNVYERMGDYKNALFYANLYIETKDTIFSQEKTEALAEMTTRYESEKKQLQIDNLNQENALKQAELAQSEEKRNKQLVLIYSFIAGFIIIMIFSLIIFRLFMQKKKANLILSQQKQQIEIQNNKLNQANEEITAQRDEIAAQRDLVTEQKEHIEEQKKEIDDSIKYAKRIQTAVLPADKYAEEILGEHFIIFRPHSVVSGDFYWATRTEEWTVIAVADCTGHGVPGAFMSMLGVSFLNEIVRKKDVVTPAEVLNHLRASVIEALKQTGEAGTQKDGMDMSIASIHLKSKLCRWAGANNPLWIVRQNAIIDECEDKSDIVEEYKADKMPVAVHINMSPFINHEIKLEAGDKLYLFSDGLPDQFGGPKGKKFLYKRFKKVLVETASLNMKEQGEQIEKELDNWMNYDGKKHEQIDDITVVGLKI